MTPRKELFIKTKAALRTIPALELVDLFRNQGTGNDFVAALIRINRIEYTSMTQNLQEGKCTVDILLYCRDGWMEQHGNGDPDDGLIEIDLLDSIAEKLQFMKGESFKPLHQIDEETEEQEEKGIMSYRVSFSTEIYRRLNHQYTAKKVILNQ